MPSSDATPQPTGPDFFSMLCRYSTIIPIVAALIAVTVAALAVPWLVPVVGV